MIKQLIDSKKKKVGLSTMEKRSNIYSNFYFTSKRIFDVCISLIALVITLPITLVTSIFIYLEDRGPILYTQDRIGKNGRTFKIYKFRSMCVDADSKKNDLITMNEVKGAMFKISSDPRVTKVGFFIRRHSIDELPQLFNVLRGDMSLVGPRPPLPEEVEKYTDYDKKRLVVKPGCTGLWQISGRNSLDFNEMVDLDIKYIRNAGLFLDIEICFMTIWIMIIPNDAF